MCLHSLLHILSTFFKTIFLISPLINFIKLVIVSIFIYSKEFSFIKQDKYSNKFLE